MGELKFIDITQAEFMEMLHELKSNGLILNKDFEWSFHPTRVVSGYSEPWKVEEKHWIITFHNPKHLTFYSLKWNKYL